MTLELALRLAGAIAIWLATASTARADEAFEMAVQSAEHVRDVEALVWSLTAPCDRGDDVEQRQCRLVRDARRHELASRTLLLDADPAALEVGAWDPTKRSIAVTIGGCVRCTATVDVDGKPWFVVGAGPPRYDGGKLHGNVVAQTTRAFLDEATATAWAKTVARARIELLVKVPAKPRWADAAHQAVQLDIVGYRAYLPCVGAVIVASPASEHVAPDKHACSVDDSTGIPDELAQDAITDAMKQIVAAANTCFAKFHVAGSATLKLSVAGDGTVVKLEETGDLLGTPTAACVDKAAAGVRLPRTKKPITTFSVPIRLQ